MILNYYDTPIYYMVHGQGPAIVLLHGFLESSRMWDQLILKISKDKTIITIDLPGHGNSGCISKSHSMELMADVVHAILKKHKIDSAAFFGHSMGGYVALAFAEKHYKVINKLILINSTPAADSEERKLNRDRAIKVINQNPKAFISMAIHNLFVKSSQIQYALEIQKMKKEALSFPVEGIIATIIGMKNRKDRSLILKELNIEKIMICGNEDPLIPYDVAKTLALESGTKLKKLAGGHMSLIENFDKIVKICT